MLGKLPEVNVSPVVFCQVPGRVYLVPTNLKLEPVMKVVKPLQLENMDSIDITLEVSSGLKSRLVKLLQPENM